MEKVNLNNDLDSNFVAYPKSEVGDVRPLATFCSSLPLLLTVFSQMKLSEYSLCIISMSELSLSLFSI